MKSKKLNLAWYPIKTQSCLELHKSPTSLGTLKRPNLSWRILETQSSLTTHYMNWSVITLYGSYLMHQSSHFIHKIKSHSIIMHNESCVALNVSSQRPHVTDIIIFKSKKPRLHLESAKTSTCLEKFNNTLFFFRIRCSLKTNSIQFSSGNKLKSSSRLAVKSSSRLEVK